jgi:hypothetical protein
MLLIYKVQQFSVQYKMRLAVNGNGASFEKLILSISEYRNSLINSRELYVRGNLYDVKSVNIIGDKVELLVINDLKEKILLQEIKDFLQKSNQSKKELPDKLQKFLSINYLAADEGQLIYFPSFSCNFYLCHNPGTLTEESDIPSPPPKFC